MAFTTSQFRSLSGSPSSFFVSSIAHPSSNIYLLAQQFSGLYPVRLDDRWLQSLDGRDGSAVIPIH